MKQKSLLLIMAATAAMAGLTLSPYAQNTAPYWSLAGNSTATTSSKFGTTNAVPLRLHTNNSVRLFINGSSGNVGIGTGSSASSSYKLYVTGGSNGIYGKGTGSYGIYGQGGSYGVYGSGTGYGVYGDSYGGVAVNGSSTSGIGGYFSSSSYTALEARTLSGDYGVEVYNSYRYGAGIFGDGGEYGVIGNSDNGIGVQGSSAYGWAGYFNGPVYSTSGFITSDRRLKIDIEDVGSAMSIINKLQPKHYEFKNDVQYAALHLPSGTHYGLIAQDLEQVLPNLVRDSKVNLSLLKHKSPDGKDANQNQQTAPAIKTESIDVKAVNYFELIPIMIKAMQEQNETIQQQDKKIGALTQQVNALTASKQSGTSNASAAIKLSNAYLGQSAPNPATGTATIQYNNLPAGARAQLLVSDANGRMIKQVQLSSNNGVVDFDVSSLSTGTYTYSLVIDGRLVEAKTMQVTR